ncbi:CHASE2 domain-containing protein [Pollutimonas bauzanensis]|jgi:CHASE2 domain-containing sensor protein|uniref:CHASE2 domain-containing protein n=1 Tax=Pollutimonas bauzanensis TaxID=658167 RepID=UPI003341BA8B
MPRSVEHTDANFWGGLERRTRIEWLLVTLVMMLMTMAASYFGDSIGLTRLDHTFYDKTLSAAVQSSNTDKIVIVAIDDGSINQLGYWPWRRIVHAQLLDRLHEAKVVGVDLVFNEINPAYPEDDTILAEAIHRHGNVVLPLVVEKGNHNTLAPLPLLANAAERLGYINIYPDEDGVIRSLVPQQTLASGLHVEHFVTAITRAANNLVDVPSSQQPDASPRLIPYAGTPGHFTMYPYAQVLDGQIPESSFKDKYVLIGSWGSGLGDAFPTPRSLHGETMAGVEILANGLLSTLDNNWITTPNRWQAALLAALPVFLICLGLRRLSPRRSFAIALAVLALIFIVSGLLMHYANIWVPITASLIGVALAYPVWSWRSQEAALQHIDGELQTLHQETAEHGNSSLPGSPSPTDGSLSARVTQLHSAIGQLRQARQKREETMRFLSHDMRAPQNSILALTQLQKQPESELPEAELLRRIDLYAHKTLSLVDGFVQLARAEAMTIRHQSVDLVELVELSRDDFWAQAKQRHISILFTEHPEAAWIDGDEALLRRACCNVIDNAIKYSPENSTITCSIVNDSNDWLVIVSDQGRGISEAQQQNLFTPFMRADENVHGNPGGVGLGLAFTNTVVARHGGSIQAKSHEGAGATFILRFTAKKDIDD